MMRLFLVLLVIFTVTVRNVKISAGAGFIVVLTGKIMTMPGLPKVPAAEKIVLRKMEKFMVILNKNILQIMC